ncbi:MAG: GNAT family N-acetyltransferase [Acutalibacteraceae bacterium]
MNQSDTQTEVTVASYDDYDELLRFENRVFKTSFTKIMPKIYRDREKCTDSHIVIKDNGKIIAALALYDTKLILGESEIKAVGIGSVAVDKKYRGKGLMKTLLEKADELAIQKGAEIAVLSGYRQRYSRFGFEKCGIHHIFTLSNYFINHFKPKKKLKFQMPFSSADLLHQCAKLYSLEKYRWERKETEFSDIISTWNLDSYAVFDGHRLLGFIVCDRNEIKNFHLSDPSDAAEVLCAFAKVKRRWTLNVRVTDLQHELIRELSEICEEHKISDDASYKIYDFKSFINKMLRYKSETVGLIDAEVKISIDGKKLKIRCADGVPDVSDCTAQEKADIETDAVTATRLLSTCGGFNEYNNPVLNAWSPICPVSISTVDEI